MYSEDYLRICGGSVEGAGMEELEACVGYAVIYIILQYIQYHFTLVVIF